LCLGAAVALVGLLAACGSAHGHRPYTIDGVPDNDSFHPSWAPDGRSLVFAFDYQLYVHDFRTGRTRRLTSGGALKRDPIWSPDGTEIAYTATSLDTVTAIGGTYFCGLIYVIRPNGSHRRRLSPPGASDCDAAWSPDGKHLAVDGIRPDSSSHVCRGPTTPGRLPCPPPGSGQGLDVITVRGAEQRAVMYRGDGFESFSWSPDGTRLAFSDFSPAHTYVFDLRSGRVTDVAARIVRERPGMRYDLFDDPAWSPDGRRLAIDIDPKAARPRWLVVREGGSGPNVVRAPSWIPCGQTLNVPQCHGVRSPDGTRTAWDTREALLVTRHGHRRVSMLARR
jgi:Tol biopolymer transport system component